MPDPHPIVTITGPGRTLSQGPTVQPADPRGFLPTDMHGYIQIRLSDTQTAWGLPVPKVRRGGDE